MFPTRLIPGACPRGVLAAAALTLGLTLQPGLPKAEPAAAPSLAATPPAAIPVARITPAAIEAASYDGGDLPMGQSALTAKVQVLLDRSGISPGVVDGWRGGMSESAIRAFQRRAGLPTTGRLDHAVWDLLNGYARMPLISEYTITEDDAYGLVDNIPSDYGEKARMTSQGYTSILEKLGERFHMDEKFLAGLNPDKSFVPGETIQVTLPARPIRATVTRIIIDKTTRRVAAYDAGGRLVADYPATIGSAETPSPSGSHVVDAVALNPTYTYNPRTNFKQGDNDRVLIVPPGPNGPVGNVWIDLSKPSYGIHGTATPSRLFKNQSNGCVRLTNWDAYELAHMVQSGRTTVEFLDPGVSIDDVIGVAGAFAQTQAAPISALGARRPTARGFRQPPQVASIPDAGPATPVAAPPAAEAATPPAPAATIPVVMPAGPQDVIAGSILPPAAERQMPEATAPDEPLVPAYAPVVPEDEPEYPSDAGLPDTLPGDPAASVTLFPAP
ncbi:Lipoprotein-anchoring transpeptidase ErfK/SrfK [Paracoccus halophilus]|uniref:Lipoprotein-anchoring transpeptidase ErfK/SrfK n=1 Tax=Paracoccus halophilus TaxID=376733 RepID=A0A099F973_9RHOB|nr:L,D-transpeptidase [Paracoccus halophilus]KGJ06632.1 hypothetical protein IT41_00140 [Paracoccus halophilus]SFA42568.1 Lipoprotein-anchoring transpeptidase ErfK/SrfK [Paracoccus halophilus]